MQLHWLGHNRYAYRASDRPDILTYRQEIGSAKIWLSLPMRGRYFQWKEMAMLSRILSGLVQEKDKFCPCAFTKELYESTSKLNHFNNNDFCAWFCRFYTQIRWSFRFIFAFLMISKITKSHWKSAMYCYCLFPLQVNRALHSYLTKQKINVDHISKSMHISHDDYLFILKNLLPDVRTLPRRPKYFFFRACTIVSQGVFNSTLML